MNIVLDFGHGGINKHGEYVTAPSKMFQHKDGTIAYEGVINREIGGLIYQFIRWDKDLIPKLTVKADDPRDISLSYRVRVANSFPKEETLMVSIHCNASSNQDARGFEIFTSKGNTEADPLATDIFNSVKPLYDKMNIPMRKDTNDGDPDKEKDFYVVKKTKCPAVLVEVLFFDNEEDWRLLQDLKFQMNVAFAVYKGIKTYTERNTNIA